jgi:hypothetical protein
VKSYEEISDMIKAELPIEGVDLGECSDEQVDALVKQIKSQGMTCEIVTEC